jgi:hypothetical protein
MPIDAYIQSLSERYAACGATEHTHRPALQNLLQTLLPDLTVMNEPAKRDCGMPGFTPLRKNHELYHVGVPIAYIEAKDILGGA